MATTHQIHLRLPADTHDRVSTEAAAKQVTVTAWINHAITAYLTALDQQPTKATP